MVEAYLEILEEGYYEAKIAFEGLADENVWKRPTPTLLSIGEIAGHMAFWEASRFAGVGGDPLPDPAKCRIASPLIDQRFAYYTHSLGQSLTPMHLAMTAEQVCAELVRVHTEAVAYFKADAPDLDGHPPGWSPNWTYRAFVTYLAFHVAYHTGQMYTVRHLLGDTPTDN